ncbi:uncharacterized protein BDW70DRAFT_150697 [Aspergillus foveolatus]|uniref:uncharacterized protein n=1 Tax=Aspergillus foveolatus TaxID=210207 RepID=UPI003CCD1B8D
MTARRQYPRHFPALESQSNHLNRVSANRFLVPNTDRAPHFPSHGDLVQLHEPRCNQASSVGRFAYVVDLGKHRTWSWGYAEEEEGTLSLRSTVGLKDKERRLTERIDHHSLEYLAHWRLPAHWAELGDKQFNLQVCPTPSLQNRTLITRSTTTVVLLVQITHRLRNLEAKKKFSGTFFNMAHNSSTGNTGHHSLSTQLQWLWTNKVSHRLMAYPHIQDTLQVSGTLRIIPPHQATTNPDLLHPNISIRSTQVYHKTAIILEAQIPDRWPLALNHNLLCPQEQFTRHPILRLFQQTHRHIEYYRVQRSQGVLITDVMAANSQLSAIFCVTKERNQALWRKQSVQAVALSSRVPLREISTLLRENARRPEEIHPVVRMRYS